MAGVAKTVLDSIVQSLRSEAGPSGLAVVIAGESADETAVPRANVLYRGCDAFEPDDSPAGGWLRLRYRVEVRTRCDGAASGLGRAAELAESAVVALLADPYRGGVCADLPVGRATEIGRVEVLTQLRRPEAGVALEVRCHVEES